MRAAIASLRYVPNLSAGSLASNRSRIIAIIVPTIANSIFSDTIDGLGQTLAQHHYQLLLGQTQYRMDEEGVLVEAFLGRHVAAALVAAPSTPTDGAVAFAGLLADHTLRAVFCSNDMLAAGVLFECARRRIAVPQQMAVMGFADLPIATGIEPALTSVQVGAKEMGERAGVLLLQRLAGDTIRERSIDLGFAVVERAST